MYSFYFVLTENAAGLIGDLGGVQDILSTMRAFPEDPEVSGNCCSALSCLTINGKQLDFSLLQYLYFPITKKFIFQM